MDQFLSELNSKISPDPEGKVFVSIWKEYERVVLDSLITTFGLDFLVHDQRGGDVDTVHNVKETKSFKNERYAEKYRARDKYDAQKYHDGDSSYRAERNKFNQTGNLIEDAYVPNKLLYFNKGAGPWQRASQDHVISAQQIHDDPVRMLTDIDPVSLANSPDNLRFTNLALNQKMSNMPIDDFIQWCKDNPDKVNWDGKKGEPIPEEVIERLREEDKRAHEKYESTIAKEYYSSPQFYIDLSLAAGKRSFEMGIKQALGFVLLEIWFSCKNELNLLPPGRSIRECILAIPNGIAKGLETALKKYKGLLSRFGQGFISGLMSSITTTLCNMFFTTEVLLVRCIRYGYSSVIQAGTILLINPDDLFLGDQIKAATITIGTGASAIAGSYIGDLVGKTPLGQHPQVGPHFIKFTSVLVSGLLSCSMLIILDRSKPINNLIARMNQYATEERNSLQLSQQFIEIAATLENMDLDEFSAECHRYKCIASTISQAKSEEELDLMLEEVFHDYEINNPWNGDFDEFMSDRNNILNFE